MITTRYLLVLTLLLVPDSVLACGWWGDSEMSSRRETATVTPEGATIEHTLNLENMKLPGRMGYGIAVPEPGRAIPYLVATFGQPLNRIQELKIFGFRSVIDLSTPEPEASRHREETESVGMRYFNIPLKGDMPEPEQEELFNKIIQDARNGPLLVYASKAHLIGMMWASYRLNMGSPMEFSIKEGRTLGLTEKQEAKLRKH